MKNTAMTPNEELAQCIASMTTDQLHDFLNDPFVRSILKGKFDFSAIPSAK